MIPPEIIDEFFKWNFGTSDQHEINEKFGWTFDLCQERPQVFWHYPEPGKFKRYLDEFNGKMLLEWVGRFNEFLRVQEQPYTIVIPPGRFRVITDDTGWLFVAHELEVKYEGRD